jgi:DNA-binding NarL/FixJ family response regulator
LDQIISRRRYSTVQEICIPDLGVISKYTVRAHKPAASALVDPVCEQELEVLLLMANGLSNPQIAHKQYISPKTLKAHSQYTYLKLSTYNRMEAVNKARELRCCSRIIHPARGTQLLLNPGSLI